MTQTKPTLKEDFYEYVNADWLKQAKIPEDKPSINSFQELNEGIEKKLLTDFDQFLEQENETKQLTEFLRFYQQALDTEKREADGVAPARKYLERVEKLTNLTELNNQLASWTLDGLPLPFIIDVDADMKNTSIHTLLAYAPRLFLPDKTYYAAENETGKKLLAVFADMSTKLLLLFGKTEVEAKQVVAEALAFDRLLVPHVKDSEEAADYSKIYNPQSFDTFVKHSSFLDLSSYIQELIASKPEEIIVADPAYYQALDQFLTEENFPLLKSWLLTVLVNSLSKFLTEELRQVSSQYQQALSGSQEITKPKKAAYYLASETFDQVVGDYYGRTYFGEKAKADVQQMVKNMIRVYKKRLETNQWLKKKTREKAIIKLEHLGIQIGYPDTIKEIYGKFIVDETASLLENTMTFTHLTKQDTFAKWHTPVIREEWEMSAHTVNAYYHPFRNMIVFPAAILQKPFYNFENSSSTNYGGIGAVIAHEISHAFDNNGALFDELGNLNNWWTDEDLQHFQQLGEEMIQQFEGLPVLDGQVNGKLTVSENIADAGGLSCAVEAAKQDAEVNLAELFTNWATIWRNKSSAEYTKLLLAIDVHAPAKLRANVQLKNSADFYSVFSIAATDPMYLEPAKRVHIW